jgi:hypothetical protein
LALKNLLTLSWVTTVFLPGLRIADNKNCVTTSAADMRSWRERLDSGVELQHQAVFGVELLERPLASMPAFRVYSVSSVMMLMTRALYGQEESER